MVALIFESTALNFAVSELVREQGYGTVSDAVPMRERHGSRLESMKKAPDPRELKEEILAVRRGDQNAFAKLLARYTPLMESLVTKFFHSEASAVSRDDLCQEAMLVFYQSILTYDTEQTEVEFGLYAKICMTNALVSQLRAVRNRRVEPLSESETELLFVHDTEDPSYRILEQ